MTRGQQTAWIVGTLIVIALGALYFATRADPSDPYAKCQRLIGYDSACKARIAANRLLSL